MDSLDKGLHSVRSLRRGSQNRSRHSRDWLEKGAGEWREQSFILWCRADISERREGRKEDLGEAPWTTAQFQDRFCNATANTQARDFHSGPVVETLHSQCSRHKFDPWSGN